MIIDVHAHTSNHKLWNLHTEDASLAFLEKLMDENGVTKTILMATYFPLKRTGLPNLELAKRIAGNQKFSMFGSLDMTKGLTPQLQELEKLSQEKIICGIKLYPGYQLFHPAEERAFPVYQLAQRYGLPVMFHGGELHHCCPKEKRLAGEFHCGKGRCLLDEVGELSHPRYLETPAKLFGDVKFIASHLANPYFEELRQVMRGNHNILTDISGQFISGSEDTPEYKKEVEVEISKFLDLPNGEDRLMFATDFPIQSHASSLELIESLGLPVAIKEKIYSLNALATIPNL